MATATRRHAAAAPAAAAGPPAALADLALALLLAAATFALYRRLGGPALDRQSAQPHFVLLADALLRGHLWIDPARAARLGDITPFAGRYYVSFPPMPAVLLLPFVAAAGPGFDDRLFSIALGALDVGLAYLLVRRLSAPGFAGPGLPLGRGQALAVAATLGLGTVLCYSAVTGTVWYLAHVVGVGFLLLYLLECAGQGRALPAGLALACAFLARTPAIFGGIFWLLLALRATPAPAVLGRRLARLAAPVALAVALLLWQNQVRFGAPLDFGYGKMRIAAQLAPRLRDWGQFNTHFLPDNLKALLVDPPLVAPVSLPAWLALVGGPRGLPRLFLGDQGLPFPVSFDPWGTGLWAVSPVFIFLLRPPRRQEAPLALAAFAAALAVALPDLLYYNTGWGQYGDRFFLDFAPFLLVPLAMALRRPFTAGWRLLFALLLAVSVLSNVLGTRWFLRLPPY